MLIIYIIPLFPLVSQTIPDEVFNVPAESRMRSSMSSLDLQTHP